MIKITKHLPMKRIITLLLLISTALVSYPQVKCIMKADRAENKVVYKKKFIKIFAGQKIHLSSSKSSGKLNDICLLDSLKSEIQDFQNMSATLERHNSEKQICIDFNQILPVNEKSMTVLLVKNPYRKRVTYKARIYSPEKKRFVNTDVLPIMPGISAVITWPFPVSSVILYHFKVSKD